MLLCQNDKVWYFFFKLFVYLTSFFKVIGTDGVFWEILWKWVELKRFDILNNLFDIFKFIIHGRKERLDCWYKVKK